MGIQNVYDLDTTFAGSKDEDEMLHDNELFSPRQPSLPRNTSRISHPPAAQMPTDAQMAGFDPATMMTFMQTILSENQWLQSESAKRPRAEKDDKEEGEPPIKLHIKEGHNDAWTIVHQAARNIRPYCGDWTAHFKILEKKAKPAKESLDWEPLGTIKISNARQRVNPDPQDVLAAKS